MLIIFALPKTNTREHNYTATYPHVDRPVTALCSGSSLTRTVRGRNELQRHLHSIMYKTAAITACLAGVVAGLQLPTRRQFGIGVGTAAVVPPALAAGGKVVVVGGAGFVGTEISHLLATQGVKVVSVSRRSAAAQCAVFASWLTFGEGSCADFLLSSYMFRTATLLPVLPRA